jgi:hypothetical protein
MMVTPGNKSRLKVLMFAGKQNMGVVYLWQEQKAGLGS